MRSHRTRVRAIHLVMLATVFLVACGGELLSDEDPGESGVETIEGSLFVDTSRLPLASANSYETHVRVCYAGKQSERSMEKQWVRDILSATWVDTSLVRFSWLSGCNGTEDIKIVISDTPTANRPTYHHQSHEMLLNFTFNHFSPTCKAHRKGCIEVLAVHEFGHALGFKHENLRPDFSWCANGSIPGDRGNSGDFATRENPDTPSIMSYCPEGQWSGLLSQADKRDIGRFYGSTGLTVQSGKTYALRSQATGKYLALGHRVTPALRTKIKDDKAALWRLERASGSGATLKYGDLVKITGLTATPSLFVGNWRIDRVGPNVGDVVNINDPVRLVKEECTRTCTNKYIEIPGGGEKRWRILGDFAPGSIFN